VKMGSAFKGMRAGVCVCDRALRFLQRYLHNKIITNTTHKLKYLHTYLHTENIYKNTSTPPPNLKHHIAHNVTELTNLGDGSI
jgi:hypothetical protein